MARVCLSFFCLFFLLTSLARAEEVTPTLTEAVAVALRDNRTVLISAEEVSRAKAKITESQAVLWPSLSLVVGRSYTQELLPKNFDQTQGQATLKQYLYQGGKTTNTIAQSEYLAQAQQAALDDTKLE